jgi:hypothetical protein
MEIANAALEMLWRISDVYRPRFLGHRIEPYAASAAD